MNQSFPNATSTPPVGGQVVQQSVRVGGGMSIKGLETGIVQHTWDHAVKLVEFQCRPGFHIEKVIVGAKECDGTNYAGSKVSKDEPVTVVVYNDEPDPEMFSGIWFTEDLEPAPTIGNGGGAPVPVIMPDPSSGQTVTIVGGRPPMVEAPQGQQFTHNAAQPQGAMQSPTEFVYQPQSGAVMQSGGMEFHHVGQQAPPPPPAEHRTFVDRQQFPERVSVGDGEVVVLFSRERAMKVLFALKGGIIQPQEIPAITHAIKSALHTKRGSVVTPGMNEIGVVLSRGQAERVIAIVEGSDWQTVQGLMIKFQQVLGMA